MNRHGIRRFFNLFITKRTLDDQDRSRLDRRVAESEKKTGVELVLAVIDRCDVYTELPWKAFALGASIAGLLILIVDLLRPVWVPGNAVLFSVAAILAAGAFGALLCVLVPGFARLFLDEERAEVETRQYAESLFLSRELFNTGKRTGILLLIALFERCVIVLPDTGIGKRLKQTALDEIITHMTKILTSGQIADALEEGIRGLERALSATAPLRPEGNELSDKVIEEKGP
jgi:putative membrane protein